MSGSQTENQDMLIVTMLGGFTLSYRDIVISETSSRTHQVWNLMEILIANRKKPISQESLIAAMWPNENCENPANALKNLVYRIRSTLSNQGLPFAKELILFQNGTYRWNNHIPCTVDTEEFDELCQQASSLMLSDNIRIGLYQRAIGLYKGNFLSASPYEEWVVSQSSIYRASYFDCVYHALSLLQKQERYFDMETICSKAVQIDPYEEKANVIYIRSLISQGKQKQALQHYNYIIDLYFRDLGVTPSAEMRSLYREIAKSVHNVETDLNIIKEDLREANEIKGAFFCEYEVFKDMYRVEARSAARTGQAIFIGLLTLISPDGSVPETSLLAPAMDNLQECVRSSLRCGDVFSRFSSSQFVLMLPTRTYENGQMVLNRIINNYKRHYRLKGIAVLSNLQPLDPIERLS